MMIFIWRVFHPPNLMIINDIVYFEFNPLIMILVTVVIHFGVRLTEKLFRPRLSATVVRLNFTVGSETFSCVGKIDTGCTLREPFSDTPVIIVDRSVCKTDDREQRRVIPYTAVGSSSYLFGVPSCKIAIDGKSVDRPIYIASADLNHSTYQAIINSDILR